MSVFFCKQFTLHFPSIMFPFGIDAGNGLEADLKRTCVEVRVKRVEVRVKRLEVRVETISDGPAPNGILLLFVLRSPVSARGL